MSEKKEAIALLGVLVVGVVIAIALYFRKTPVSTVVATAKKSVDTVQNMLFPADLSMSNYAEYDPAGDWNLPYYLVYNVPYRGSTSVAPSLVAPSLNSPGTAAPDTQQPRIT